jgi:hypothetical protein
MRTTGQNSVTFCLTVLNKYCRYSNIKLTQPSPFQIAARGLWVREPPLLPRLLVHLLPPARPPTGGGGPLLTRRARARRLCWHPSESQARLRLIENEQKLQIFRKVQSPSSRDSDFGPKLYFGLCEKEFVTQKSAGVELTF